MLLSELLKDVYKPGGGWVPSTKREPLCCHRNKPIASPLREHPLALMIFSTPFTHSDKPLYDSSFSSCYAPPPLPSWQHGLRHSMFPSTPLVVTVWQPSNLFLQSGSDLITSPCVFRQPRGRASPRFHDASGCHQHQNGSERGDSGAGMHCWGLVSRQWSNFCCGTIKCAFNVC